MKRIFEVKVETDRETAVREYLVLQPNAIAAAKAGIRAYRKDDSKLFGAARVTSVAEAGTLDG